MLLAFILHCIYGKRLFCLICVYIHTQVLNMEVREQGRKPHEYFVLSLCFCFGFLFGDRVLVTIQVRRRRYVTVLGFTVVSHCILEDRRRGNLKHRRRGGESVLRKACTRASTSRQTFVVVVVASFSVYSPNFIFAIHCNLFDV